MNNLLPYIIAFPFLGFLVLSLVGKRMPKKIISWTGAGSIGIAALLTITGGLGFLQNGAQPVAVRLWEWIDVAGLQAHFSLYLDALSLVFIFVITFVGFFIHLYATEYMREDGSTHRFFAYMNLFVTSMLILVLADNLVLLYLGWEGVGLCSFLLIGYWYKDKNNVAAARKAFVVTRIGDVALAIGLFLLFMQFGTLHLGELIQVIPVEWSGGDRMATIIALLLLGGAVGKSAQLPLQTWLPDAMAGPTPVSALIHAATMVTAGVYLIARTHVVFLFSPIAMAIVAVIGALTLLVAGISAIVQTDIKKVLAYSTISQIGYMFLGLGVGAWSAAIFHFMTHAFFKALLFLGAGAVITAVHHEQDMFKMGGLKRVMPVTFFTFLAGSASLAALPLITAGFYSKDQILWYTWSSENGGLILWLAGMAGALITAFYTFRMVFLTFYGNPRSESHYHPGPAVHIPLIVLALASVFGGFIELPHNMGHFTVFSDLMLKTLPTTPILHEGSATTETILQAVSGLLVVTGIYFAHLIFVRGKNVARLTAHTYPRIRHFLLRGWDFDRLYDRILVRPVVKMARINRHDFIDSIYTGIARMHVATHTYLSKTQNGKLRWYTMAMTAGIIMIITIILMQ